MRKHQRSDLIWLVCGQGAMALGGLIGVRLLTQMIEPSTYGVISLGLGIVTMTMNLSSTPLIQAAMHFYPQFLQQGELHVLAQSLYRTLKTTAFYGLPVVLAATGAYMTVTDDSAVLPSVLVLLLGSEIYRSLQLSILNSARRHRRYAAWIACDAWARPLLATAAIVLLGDRSTVALGAYAVAAAFVASVFSTRLWPNAAKDAPYTGLDKDVDRRLWFYAIPLIPVAIIVWLSNVGDRYIIAGLLSLSDAGIYAAAYALSSAPFIAVNTVAEQALRPLYQQAISLREHLRCGQLLRLWLLGLTLAGAAGVLFFALFHAQIARIFLGEAFRQISGVMPWIAAGYAVRSIAYVLERVCYAHGRTQRVLASQMCGAVTAVLTALIGTWQWGLMGAAIAVPVYFTLQLAAAMFFVRDLVDIAGADPFSSSRTLSYWTGCRRDAR